MKSHILNRENIISVSKRKLYKKYYITKKYAPRIFTAQETNQLENKIYIIEIAFEVIYKLYIDSFFHLISTFKVSVAVSG